MSASELSKLSDELAAQTDAFLRAGGSITQLDYAGVPVDGTLLEPKPVRAYGRLYESSAPVKAQPVAPLAPADKPTAPIDIISELRRIRRDARRLLANLEAAIGRTA